MARQLPFIPYPSINRHGVIGDRRTAALVASDGTIDWLCLPNYDGDSVFAGILDAERGGFWRFGPAIPITGSHHYLENTATLTTTWETRQGELELSDLMAWPQDDRPARDEKRRVMIRRLRCIRGAVTYTMHLCPRAHFDVPAKTTPVPQGTKLDLGEYSLGLWTSFPVQPSDGGVEARGTISEGEELWAVLELDEEPGRWQLDDAHDIFEECIRYWRGWLATLDYMGPRNQHMRRSALLLHLLGYAPEGSMVAAPTTSLPERIGGEHNYDYRYAWVRDASLSVAGLSLLGSKDTSTRYLDWLAQLKSDFATPLQVAYRIDGRTDLHEVHRTDLAGYRGSLPVRLGNRAFAQIQLGSLGYLADCALIHLNLSGTWRHDYWEMIWRIAEFARAHWHEPDSGIWELPQQEHYVSSKVMSWVVLDRAVAIAERTGHPDAAEPWRKARDAVHKDVMKRGWSDSERCFVQRYGSDALDASALLIPVMGFLPADHPRVLATVDRIVEQLSIDGLVYRFQPIETPVRQHWPMGEFEGSFLPCTFWLATAYALAGRVSDADRILHRAESLTHDLFLFAEEADARNDEMLGNYPLLFSQVEYIRAVLALSNAKSGYRPHQHATGRAGHESGAHRPPGHRPAASPAGSR